MEKNTDRARTGARVKKGGGGKLAAAVCAGAVAVLAAGYAGLCAWAGGHVLPHSTVAGVDVGGVSTAQLSQRLEEAAQDYRGQTVNLTYDTVSIPCQLDQAGLAFDEEAALEQLSAGGESFFRRGAAWLRALVGEGSQVQGALKFQNQDYVDQLLDQVTSSLDQPVVQHQAQVGDSSILFTRGQAGMAVDTQATEATLLERLSQGDLSDLPLEASVTEPDDPDFDALYQQVHTQPMDAALDPTTYEITPSTNGLSFDVATAQALFERTQPGESCSIPLTVTEPEITTEKLQASLFADLLGEAKSTVSGSAARKANVKLAGQMCSGTILLPGEVFSYWDKISPCSASQGFQAAPSYQNGQTVDSIGGGVCQVSSSIYYAALLSNLEIVQRQNHSYAVGYLPNGADATVFSGNPDFKFKNNTNYPIKIVATMSGNSLSVQIWGTKTDDTYVKMEFNDLSSTPYQTIYQIDDSVPAGTTKVSVTGYTGYKTEAYRCIYDGSGKLVSRTLESVSTYKKRDKIVLVNSADAAKYGLEGGTTPAEPSPSTTPDQTTPAPSPSTTPSPEPSTSPTTQPEPTPTPATSGETTSTQTTPAETQTETPSPTPSINIPPAP